MSINDTTSIKSVSSSRSHTNKLIEDIKKLQKEKNAIILSHYYQNNEIQDISDFIGDSLELSKKAEATDAEVIIFCGVHFMAETAKIINPNKKVIIPDINAGCSLADECPANEFIKFKKEFPDHFVISYINCSAEVKAQSDLICTSSNAVDLVNKIPKNKSIIFAPDKNLGRWVKKQSGRDMQIWNGSCIVHETFNEEALLKLKLKHPNSEIIAHPECEENLLIQADFIGSTSKLIDYSFSSSNKEFIVLTEPGILHQMKIRMPEKSFYDVPGIDGCSCNECPHMRLNTLEKILKCLDLLEPNIIMEDELIKKAYKPIKLMLEMSK